MCIRNAHLAYSNFVPSYRSSTISLSQFLPVSSSTSFSYWSLTFDMSNNTIVVVFHVSLQFTHCVIKWQPRRHIFLNIPQIFGPFSLDLKPNVNFFKLVSSGFWSVVYSFICYQKINILWYDRIIWIFVNFLRLFLKIFQNPLVLASSIKSLKFPLFDHSVFPWSSEIICRVRRGYGKVEEMLARFVLFRLVAKNQIA